MKRSTTAFIEEFYRDHLQHLCIMLTDIEFEEQNSIYVGSKFNINNHSIRFRKAKSTPTKSGLFVVAWEKDDLNVNQAYHYDHAPTYLMIYCEVEDNKGIFMFSKDILLERKILSSDTQKGKMGFRIYPPWEDKLNQQALQTQTWQCKSFIPFEILNADQLFRTLK